MPINVKMLLVEPIAVEKDEVYLKAFEKYE